MHFFHLFTPSQWNVAQKCDYLTTSFYKILPSKQTQLIFTAPAISRLLIYSITQSCRSTKERKLKVRTVYTQNIPTSHSHLTRSDTLEQLTPDDSPGTLITVSMYCNGNRLKLVFVALPRHMANYCNNIHQYGFLDIRVTASLCNLSFIK